MTNAEEKMAVSAPIIELPETPTLTSLMMTFCSLSSTPKIMQDTIHALTHEIISAAKSHDQTLTQSPTTMIPILRGALPMFVAAQPLLPATSCILARCSKTKGTQDVVVDWLGRRPFPRESDDGKIVILDTIIATGDTVVKLCEELWEMSGKQPRSVVVLCTYAAPEALERVARCPVVEYVVVGRRAEKCDERGYLVPYTNGDIGDKIYGGVWSKEEKTGKPVVAQGEEVQSVLSGVQNLLVENGGLWKLTEDGLAIEREIQFSGFKDAWTFMKQVADTATRLRHHPEWINVYNKVSIRWTTHQPKGLTNLDVVMAQLCDSYV
ncbi:Transcriptional coactivator/pterin dehydratase [Penicillium samsonianum]|uniref:Transcriptional coactivator/pterin dehydratase n=1 Tax=Penicillium samsonianum TaxID=1882272 RepID=UPI002548F7DD|nr:Transcriptional coactivator/pterin dehydratase [Penicillium samsonianum]KAJ6143939.1 Transcriptional coactivator/pterin dehydratase [Penicillium samsonianum]